MISIQPGNPFAERQGRIMNIVRDKLAQRGYFNIPDNIASHEYVQHIKTISWLWRNVIRGHDVRKANNLDRKLDLELKLPREDAKSYNKVKRKINRQNVKIGIWTSVKMKVNRVSRRLLKSRGKNVSKKSEKKKNKKRN